MKTYSKNEKGFTLIELLVVIAIIGLLSSVVLASLNEARQKATNSKVLQSANQLIRAIELYASDNNGMYPGEVYLTSQSLVFNTNKNDASATPPKVYNPSSFILGSELESYISGVLESPISQQNYSYFTSNNRIRCSNQISIPRYVILIERKGGFDPDLPGYRIDSSTVDTHACISGPEN